MRERAVASKPGDEFADNRVIRVPVAAKLLPPTLPDNAEDGGGIDWLIRPPNAKAAQQSDHSAVPVSQQQFVAGLQLSHAGNRYPTAVVKRSPDEAALGGK